MLCIVSLVTYWAGDQRFRADRAASTIASPPSDVRMSPARPPVASPSTPPMTPPAGPATAVPMIIPRVDPRVMLRDAPPATADQQFLTMCESRYNFALRNRHSVESARAAGPDHRRTVAHRCASSPNCCDRAERPVQRYPLDDP